jgi:hypothetical protein
MPAKKQSPSALTDLIQTGQTMFAEARRYLANGKETIQKAGISETGKIYRDEKYVRKGAGIAYLAALKAIDGYLLKRGVGQEQLPKSIEEYWAVKKKYIPHNGKFSDNLTVAYQNLHIAAYYQGNVSVGNMKEGLKAVREIIGLLE